MSRLASSVLIDQQRPVNPERWQRVTMLSGMGGTGKSDWKAAKRCRRLWQVSGTCERWLGLSYIVEQYAVG
jgi:hypothetical protein